MRWSLVALVLFGSLALLAIAIFTVLTLCDVLEPGSDGAALYWLAALLTIVGLGVWLLLVVWCYVDAQRRGMNAPLWALLVFLLGFPVGPLLYLVLQKGSTESSAGSSAEGPSGP